MRHEVARAVKKAKERRQTEQSKGGNAFDRMMADERERERKRSLTKRQRRARRQGRRERPPRPFLDANPIADRPLAILAKLGFPSLAAYRDSNLWTNIEHGVLDANPHCIRCCKKADTVHIAHYDEATLSGRDTSKLYSLCDTCFYRVRAGSGGTILLPDRTNFLLGIIDKYGRWTGRSNAYSRQRTQRRKRRKTLASGGKKHCSQ